MVWVLTRGVLKTREHYAMAKAKPKSVRKESVAEKANILGYRLYLGLSKGTDKSGTSKNAAINQDNWKVLVCEASGKKWSDFTVTKRDIHGGKNM
jgi:hypothetical protein